MEECLENINNVLLSYTYFYLHMGISYISQHHHNRIVTCQQFGPTTIIQHMHLKDWLFYRKLYNIGKRQKIVANLKFLIEWRLIDWRLIFALISHCILWQIQQESP